MIEAILICNLLAIWVAGEYEPIIWIKRKLGVTEEDFINLPIPAPKGKWFFGKLLNCEACLSFWIGWLFVLANPEWTMLVVPPAAFVTARKVREVLDK